MNDDWDVVENAAGVIFGILLVGVLVVVFARWMGWV